MKLSSIPLRLKILLGVLVMVALVVGAITFTIAGLFHVDKKLYISDLTAAMAIHSAHEAEVVAASYRERLEAMADIVIHTDVPVAAKRDLLRKELRRFNGLVGIRFRKTTEAAQLTLLDDDAVKQDGMSRAEMESMLAGTRGDTGAGTFRMTRAAASKLPLVFIALGHGGRDGHPELVVTAVVRDDDFRRIVTRSQTIGIFLVDSKGQVVAAQDRTTGARSAHVAIIPELDDKNAAVVREYSSDGEIKIGAFAHARDGGLWAIAEVPKSAAFIASRLLLERLLIVALLLLAIAALVATNWARRITRPIQELAQAAKEVGRGRFDVNVQVRSRDEIGALASSFNQMGAELSAREQALKQAQAALMQSEKMAAFGQLGAGIAHEVKNPLAGIQGIVQLAARGIDETNPLKATLDIIEKETKRCRTIIDNLLKFARQEKAPRQVTDLERVADDAAAVMSHSLALHGVTLERTSIAQAPQVLASANQIQQVLMNLILNADQAFEGSPGIVRLETDCTEDGSAVIRVADNGPGIPSDIVGRIFEPFFTTKPAGQGTGLGLSVSFGIIKDHGGSIVVLTAPGQGTTFVITLPPAAAQGADAQTGGAAETTPEARKAA